MDPAVKPQDDVFIMNIRFRKMNGAGNDFVVFDARQAPLVLSAAQLRDIASRDNAITKGCDQVIVMEQPPVNGHRSPATVFMRIFNADGGEVEACGNATRCIAWLMMRETGTKQVAVQTKAGKLSCVNAGPMQVTADMGAPDLDWHAVANSPAEEVGMLGVPVLVSMGNPHAVFFVDEVQGVDIARLGPLIENHPVFPNRVNVSVAQVRDATHIDARVWERGVGLTQACGTAACATAVAAIERGECKRGEEIAVNQGSESLLIRWGANGHVFLTGPVALEFEGVVAL